MFHKNDAHLIFGSCEFRANTFLGRTKKYLRTPAIELLSHWDPILKEHVLKIEGLQKKAERLQVHYLSDESRNEFIAECSGLVKQHILGERQSEKYYVINRFQTRFISCWGMNHDLKLLSKFLKFVDCNDKRESKIA